MFKIIIADNDSTNTKGIETYIKQNLTYVKVEKLFNDEQSFDKFFDQSSEHIIILEIRFFSGNFYKKIKDFCKNHPKVYVIVYGKIDDLEYLEKLEQERQINYTLRPVKPIKLKKCIENTLAIIEKERGLNDYEIKIQQLYRQSTNIFESKFLSAIISGRISDEYEMKEGFDYFGINIKENFAVAIVRIDNFRTMLKALSEKEKHMIILKLLNLIEQNLKDAKTFINLFNEVVIIFNNPTSLDELITCLTEIKLQAITNLDLRVSIGIGRIYTEMHNIKTSFNEANFALRHRFIIGKNSVISIDQVEPKNTYTASYPFDREKILVYSAVIGQYEYCIKVLDEIFEVLNRAKSVYEKTIYQLIMSILISINRNSAEKGLVIENMNQFFPTSQVLNLKDLDSAYDFLKDGLKNFCDYICEQRDDYENQVFEETINYINQKYYDEINYKFMSEKLNCNAEYFKKIFEAKAKTPIYDYLHKIRIEKAKQLIIETNLTDDIIAANVGYEDVNIFRKIFKNVEGCFVGDFRHIYK